jgi:hypothetical protein
VWQLDNRANSLVERENVLEQGFTELQSLGMQLALKEETVLSGKKWVEEHQLAMRSAEDDLLNKKIAMSTMQRKSFNPPQLLASSFENTTNSRGSVAAPPQFQSIAPISGSIYPEPAYKPVRYVSDAERAVNNSMKTINNTLRASRNEMNKLNLDRANTFNFITQESQFVKKSLR